MPESKPIFEINRMLPSKIDGAAYQVIKKTQEACSMAAAHTHSASSTASSAGASSFSTVPT